MRYGVIGSRTYSDYERMRLVLDRHYISLIVSGGAIGADSLADRYAKETSIPLLEFLPDWDKYPKKAPFVRNKLIVNNSDVIVAFWDSRSTGTKHSNGLCKT